MRSCVSIGEEVSNRLAIIAMNDNLITAVSTQGIQIDTSAEMLYVVQS